MLNKFLSLLVLSLGWLLPTATSEETYSIDQRLELVSIVAKLAEFDEYNLSSNIQYKDDVDLFFAPYKEHIAVKYAKELKWTKGISYNALPAIAVALSPPPALDWTAPPKNIEDERWTEDTAEKFVTYLRDFYKVSQCGQFFEKHKTFYKSLEEEFSEKNKGIDTSELLSYLGISEKTKMEILLGLLVDPHSYGASIVGNDGIRKIYAVISPSLEMTEEQNSFAITYLMSYILLSNILEHNKTIQNQDQSIVQQNILVKRLSNAVAIRCLQKKNVDKRLIDAALEQAGDPYLPRMLQLFHEYENNRSKYPDFASFLPKIAEFYQKYTTANPSQVIVTSIKEFENGSNNVPPSLKQITVTFNAPMMTDRYSVYMDVRDQEILNGGHFTDPTTFVIKLNTLKQNHEYRMNLKGQGGHFTSETGMPLQNYEIRFKTTSDQAGVDNKTATPSPVSVTSIKEFENGSNDVPPSLKQITVTFNAPMMTDRYSVYMDVRDQKILNGGHFTDPKTFVIKLNKLKKNHEYRMDLKGHGGHFTSGAGIPLQNYEIRFKTSGL